MFSPHRAEKRLSLRAEFLESSTVVHIFNLTTWEAEALGPLSFVSKQQQFFVAI